MAAESIPIVELRGGPRARGRAHGEALRARIETVREQWRESLTIRFGTNPSFFVDAFLLETRFTDAVRRWTPALMEEIEGIAEGSGRPLNETLAFQYMDEEWWFGASRFARAPSKAGGCSIIASRGRDGDAPILAQNMDLHGFLDGGQTILRTEGADSPHATILTICGMIALCGVNEFGLGVAVNTLWQLPGSEAGLPVACVARSLLMHRDLGAAREWINSVRHASGQHYLIADPTGFASFEASGTRVEELPRASEAPAYVHTNHPLAATSNSARNPAEDNSRGRYQRLCGGLVRDQALSVDEIKAALSDRAGEHPISVRRNEKNPSAPMTFASIVMELKRPPIVQVAGGPPCSYPYRALVQMN